MRANHIIDTPEVLCTRPSPQSDNHVQTQMLFRQILTLIDKDNDRQGVRLILSNVDTDIS